MEKIGIYGGSFDPPHKGHVALAKNLAELTGVNKVFIIPAHASPFKVGCNVGDADRLFMCRAAFSEAPFEVSDIELLRGGKSYTYDTVAALKAMYPQSKMYLFMGDDMFLSLDRWYNSRELLSIVTPVAACRTNDLGALDKMHEFVKNTLKLKNGEYLLSCETPFEISSTRIRELIKAGKPVEAFLNKEVCDYIKERKLYL